MLHEKKTYLDLFLDNHTAPKKRERYFEAREENAIVKYNDLETSDKDKNILFRDVIEPAFKKIISGVLEMPQFRNLPKALNRDDLIDHTFFRLIEKIYRFTPGRIGKSGQPVKAFSYFSTIAKHFIIEQIAKHNKILKHKADVETSIDLGILSEDTLEKISKIDSHEIEFDDYITVFTATRTGIISIVRDLIIEEENKDKKDDDFIKLGYCLKYLLEKWDKIEFMKKNEFMRILILYTGFQQQKVSFLFKRFKTAVLKKIKPSALNKKQKRKVEDIFEVDEYDYINTNDINEDEIEDFEIEIEEPIEIIETEEDRIMKYDIYSMDEFEAREYKLDNAKKRKEWKRIKK